MSHFSARNNQVLQRGISKKRTSMGFRYSHDSHDSHDDEATFTTYPLNLITDNRPFREYHPLHKHEIKTMGDVPRIFNNLTQITKDNLNDINTFLDATIQIHYNTPFALECGQQMAAQTIAGLCNEWCNERKCASVMVEANFVGHQRDSFQFEDQELNVMECQAAKDHMDQFDATCANAWIKDGLFLGVFKCTENTRAVLKQHQWSLTNLIVAVDDLTLGDAREPIAKDRVIPCIHLVVYRVKCSGRVVWETICENATVYEDQETFELLDVIDWLVQEFRQEIVA